MTERFEGFPREAFDFFTELAFNNNREWFQARKADYERACRDPMRLLAAGLGADPTRSKLSRINRDIRFSRDKSPYRTYVATGFAGNYISLSAEGVFVGAGIYMPEVDALRRYREAVADDRTGRALARIVTKLKAGRYDVDTHDRLKTAPRGFPADHPRIELLKMKGLFGGKTFAPAAWLSTRKALPRIEQTIEGLKPLTAWVSEHVGSRH